MSKRTRQTADAAFWDAVREASDEDCLKTVWDASQEAHRWDWCTGAHARVIAARAVVLLQRHGVITDVGDLIEKTT